MGEACLLMRTVGVFSRSDCVRGVQVESQLGAGRFTVCACVRVCGIGLGCVMYCMYICVCMYVCMYW